MIIHKALEQARINYSPQQIPFLTQLREKLADERPYKGLKIFHNIPLTLQAVVKIEPLVLGGAEITMSAMSSITPSQQALQILKEANIHVQLNHDIYEKYDIYLDCCAELINAKPPTYGAVELTQTGALIYKNNPPRFPIISIDDCLLKNIETMSTGEGFVTALIKQVNQDIQGKKIILFGYGKVGRGIVKALLQYTQNIVVVDKNINNINLLNKDIQLFSIDELTNIKKHLKDAFCVVTATGLKNLLSLYFDKEDFGHAYLANMGAFDEFGHKFSTEDVLFGKQALNFSIEEPTPIHYLDLIFYAHNISINFLLERKLNPGYHPFDEKLSLSLLKSWSKLHHEDFNEVLKL